MRIYLHFPIKLISHATSRNSQEYQCSDCNEIYDVAVTSFGYTVNGKGDEKHQEDMVIEHFKSIVFYHGLRTRNCTSTLKKAS